MVGWCSPPLGISRHRLSTLFPFPVELTQHKKKPQRYSARAFEPTTNLNENNHIRDKINYRTLSHMLEAHWSSITALSEQSHTYSTIESSRTGTVVGFWCVSFCRTPENMHNFKATSSLSSLASCVLCAITEHENFHARWRLEKDLFSSVNQNIITFTTMLLKLATGRH